MMGIVSDVPLVPALSKDYPVPVTFELTAATAPRNKLLHFGTRINYILPKQQATTPLRP
jgi:hypothetical protein